MGSNHDEAEDSVETREQIIERIQAAFGPLPPGVSVVDELLAERREEFRREAEWMDRPPLKAEDDPLH
ncbi:MAG: hypothetical protein WEB00_14260 [Dehalococcoidia bacterium]